MVGLMQIMIYLLCIYLVYKGVEIFQIALVSENQKPRGAGLVIGILAIIAAVLIAFAAVYMTDSMAEQVGKSMQNLGR
jgi:uncharacterized membrane protein HdeD (DUF308 family)